MTDEEAKVLKKLLDRVDLAATDRYETIADSVNAYVTFRNGVADYKWSTGIGIESGAALRGGL